MLCLRGQTILAPLGPRWHAPEYRNMPRRADLKAEWERRGLCGRSQLRPQIVHFVSAPDFVKQLKLLADVGSDAFESALEALTDDGLLDDEGNWKRDLGNVCRPPELQL